jgi:hypothetical protein
MEYHGRALKEVEARSPVGPSRRPSQPWSRRSVAPALSLIRPAFVSALAASRLARRDRPEHRGLKAAGPTRADAPAMHADADLLPIAGQRRGGLIFQPSFGQSRCSGERPAHAAVAAGICSASSVVSAEAVTGGEK